MEKIKQYFKKIHSAFEKWYKERVTRRVFFVSIIIAIGLFCISSLFRIDFLFSFAIVVLMVAIASSISDTIISKRIFEATIKKIIFEHMIREIELYGQQITPSPFNEFDFKEIKRKKLSFMGTIVLKSIFIIILIALLLQ